MKPSDNHLQHTVIGTALVIFTLGVLYLIPEFDIGSFHFRRINILSDIIKKEPTPLIAKDTALIVKPVYSDTCKTGITCIEDYSEDTTGLDVFLAALDSTKKRVVRIAYFADSYVEGDIMLDPMRDSLQTLFGGNGVGFVPITSEVAGFRQTIIHSYDAWNQYSIAGEKNKEHPLGPGGSCAVPLINAKTQYRSIGKRHLNTFPTISLFYGNVDSAAIGINDDTIQLKNQRSLQKIKLNRASSSLKLTVPYHKSLDLYGVEIEDTSGITVDNFFMRGNSGIGLAYVNEQMYRNFDSLHPYDLVVLAYGLNVASEKAKDYNWYYKDMTRVVQMMKRAFPNSSILLVGCSDRGAKVDAEYTTMPMLKELVEVQRKIAAENKICFWNLFEAMGGDNTMVEWANTKPALANKDYTHLTFYGGKKVAGIFIGTLLYEKEKFDRRRKYIKG
jgi:hypothetical protein